MEAKFGVYTAFVYYKSSYQAKKHTYHEIGTSRIRF
jgi:hypothetical protein